MKLDRKLFWIFLVSMMVAEILSFAAHQVPALQIPAFIVVIVVTLAVSLWRLEYGLLFLIADQCLGSQGGRLFDLTILGFHISARMGLFAIVMTVWGFRWMVGQYKTVLRSNSRILALWAWLGLAWALGLARALWLHHPMADVIMDANGYVYALLVLPVISLARRELAQGVLTVFAAGITVLCVKSLLVFYWFSHASDNFLGDHAGAFYKWVRDTRVGEITLLQGSFPRVFVQGQIWLLLGLFFLLTISLYFHNKEFFKSKYFPIASILAALVLGSFSRSFWFAGGLMALATFIWLIAKKRAQEVSNWGTYGAASVFTGILILAAVMLMPFPYKSTVGSLAAFKNRLTNLDDAALQSRWELARPLLHAIGKHPILGTGFGSRVTYISKDPRNLAANPTGEYSTFSFEWGYGDIWLKMGLLGLLAYGLVLWNLSKWTVASAQNKLAAALPLITLAIVHFFTPYLNHPLGLGVLLLYSGIIAVQKIDKETIIKNV